MKLTEIQDPSFLKRMSVSELEVLAGDIRRFLIEELATTGGHLAPNLGVVELTLALHREFDSPNDKFVWDVGHQAYVHKILTGRASQFDTLRQHKGLCGFPKRNESVHDVWETGHSSTSLSAAMGIAVSNELSGKSDRAVAIIGDGALTGGMALEALNHIGAEQQNVIVILNDNEMSIAPNVGAMHQMLGRIRSSRKVRFAQDELETLIKKIPVIGGRLEKGSEKLKEAVKGALVPGMFFEELGFNYYGPVDGHDLDDLIEQLNYVKKEEGPVLLHVITKKGKGYRPAEFDGVGTWHGLGPYKMESGEVIKGKSKAPSYSFTVADTLTKMARDDEKLTLITPAMSVGSKLDCFEKEFPERMFDVGIAEQHAVTFAAGQATQGMKPVVSIYSTFFQRAYDQLVHDVARQNLDVTFTIDRSGLVGADGETHQGVFDIAFMRHVPNIRIVMAKDENELQHLLYSAVKYEGPIAVRFPRGEGIGVPMDETLHEISLDTWEVEREGTDVAILAFGPQVQDALKIADLLADELSVRVINARTIKPLDEKMLNALYAEGIPLVTLEEAVLKGGFGSAVLEHANEQEAFPRVKRFGIPDWYIEHGGVNELLEEIGLLPGQIAEEVRAFVNQGKKQSV
ncbi:1-deoxy-D-xylulose-5-phosphate synthase [Exiguobacterium sp. Leaf187]|uniref:1-deoxy-D-xylulose-5-phosphate synthase n=2 Tax=Exiguobacterium TaxID=33986 RepID=A0A0V8GG41_9BACL|nr:MULTISPECIES: 1-deoxy-D-xylulose-5-phosphate synthase [Exiguobacterium]AHA29209.1 1-deoxy-D-xylulose-5-phosphate synthase [Exiguobacterium sp. MH3]KNH33998.1 1-deoxy-D-xylulose-5-phosphate synthase [Exiguobacterium acetylicum]KQS20431.1 1-deoxy-D-xylulose-5-phosphate synthase [Exiguobacterium sp. Leaf187]KSU49229.1 1-deoxy-D-xylulose-5-phosphate synthase [Exiguobacterium enclense]KTR26829.1 1-deoxy-D-xylulose-5-phosphate synthase [Exiguobacterium indicum]